MTYRSLVDRDILWKAFCHLEQLKAKTSLERLALHLKVSQEDILEAIEIYRNMKIEFSLHEENGETYITPPQRMDRIKFDLSISEWFAFQSHFPGIDHFQKGPAHTTLIKKLKLIERANKKYDLFSLDETSTVSLESATEFLKAQIYEVKGGNFELIENAIFNKKLINVSLVDSGENLFHPLRIVTISNRLAVVGEYLEDHCLSYFWLENIDTVKFIEDEYIQRFNDLEVNQFIAAFRDLYGSEFRLVLKVVDPELNLEPPMEFINRTYSALNWQGEKIWGATVEPNESLMDWILSLSDKIEVLDPTDFIVKLKEYEETSYKKVS